MCYQLHMLHNPENIVSKKGVFIMILRKSQQKHIFSRLHVSIVSKSLMKIFCQLKLFVSLLRERGDIRCRSSISFFVLNITHSRAISEDIYTGCVPKQLWWLWHIQCVLKTSFLNCRFPKCAFFGTPCTFKWLGSAWSCLGLGKPSGKKSAVFLNIVQKAFCPPPPLYLNICPILQGVFFKTRFWALKIMYLFHPQISPSMPQKSLFMQISCC